jgi:hypothetical protein
MCSSTFFVRSGALTVLTLITYMASHGGMKYRHKKKEYALLIRNPGCYQTSAVADKATETHIRVLCWSLNEQGKKGKVPKRGKRLAGSNVQS